MENLKDIPGFEGLYAITTDGRVYSYKSKRFLKDTKAGVGYRKITLRKDGKSHQPYIHRLVALVYLDNPDNLPQVNHKNEDKLTIELRT